MYWYVNKEVPHLSDYVAAQRHCASITPLKSGPLKGHKPIGARKKVSQRIWTTPNGDVKVTDGWNQHTNVEVTYYSNGSITVAWPTGSMYAGTMGFVSKLLGIEINYRGSRPWVHNVVAFHTMRGTHRWERKYERIVGAFPVLKGQLMRFTRVVPGSPTGAGVTPTLSDRLILNDVIFPTVRSTNAKGAKAIRAEHREFALYMKGVLGVFNKGFSPSDYQDNGLSNLTRKDLPQLITSSAPTDNIKAVMWLAQANRAYARYGAETDDAWTRTKAKVWADFDATILGMDPARAYDWTTRYDGNVYRENVKLVVSEPQLRW
jgi:hypothetical protein